MIKSGKKFEKGFEKYIAEQEAKIYELAAMLRDDWEMSMTMSVDNSQGNRQKKEKIVDKKFK